MQIKIEPVKNTEANILADISSKCFYDTFHEQNSEKDMMLFLEGNFNEAILASEMSQPYNYFFFARAKDEISGYIKLSNAAPPSEIKESDALEIARIYVVKDKIGLGIGKSLIEFAFSFAIRYNQNSIWLGVWELNYRAINFYHNYGFRKIGQHIFRVGNDEQTDWLMKKELRK